MPDRRRSPLNGGQVQLAKRYESILETLNEEFPEQFKHREVTARFDQVDRGDLLRLKQRGLLGNESSNPDSAKDWYITQKAKRWLRTR